MTAQVGNAMLYARGLQPRDYIPTLFDVAAVWLRLFDAPPVQVNQIKVR